MNKITEFFQSFASIHSTKYRRDIDGLRGIAVLSVVVCHAFPSVLRGGFAGVDIFFVISGFLISSILINDLEKGNFSLLRFYDRRIRRIFPALVCVIFAAILIGWLILFQSEFQLLGKHVVASGMFSENFLLWSESSYFDVSSDKKPLLHLWSLAIEEQFYIVWPLVAFLIHRRYMKCMTVFVVLGVLSFSANIYYIFHDMTPAYYSPLSRGWELMVGASLAYLQKFKPELVSKHPGTQSVAGIALIIASIYLIRPEYKFPGFWAIAPTLGAFLLISAGEKQIVNRTLLSFPPLVWFGLISYPLYLWHWLFFSYSNILFGRAAKVITAMIAVSILAAVLTFVFVEMPFRSRKAAAAKPSLLMGIMACLIAISGAIFYGMVPARLDQITMPQQTEWDFLSSRTPNLDPNPTGFFPIDATRPRLALFIGDSHIAQYASRLAKVSRENQSSLGSILAIGGGCMPIKGVTSNDLGRKKCWPLRDASYQMAWEERFTTVVIGGAWNWYFFSNEYKISVDGKSMPLNSEKGRAKAFSQLEASIEELVQADKKVVFILDNPLIDFTRLVGRSVRVDSVSGGKLENKLRVTVPQEQWQLHRELATLATNAGATLVDPFSVVCANSRCEATSATGQLRYRDDGHFNPEWLLDHGGFIDQTIVH